MMKFKDVKVGTRIWKVTGHAQWQCFRKVSPTTAKRNDAPVVIPATADCEPTSSRQIHAAFVKKVAKAIGGEGVPRKSRVRKDAAK